MNRGSLEAAIRKMPAKSCFNEAPIHESGKYEALHAAKLALYRLQ